MLKYRKSHLDAMEQHLRNRKIDKEFGDQFGRYYGGAISEYKTEDADVVIVTIGGMTGTGMDAVDLAREEGIKAGLIKLRFTRPFPAKRIAKAMEGKKAFAVIDRSVSFGWSTGPMYMETRAALVDADEKFASFFRNRWIRRSRYFSGYDFKYNQKTECSKRGTRTERYTVVHG